ncbi:MAG: high light inducible protein [Prochlorococcus marinus CUG1430]|nr:high light inducible protein [Prochlorococcus marinus]MCR8537239.1 high light inducible protein [Prochlorococcus marinus CUG1430]
MISRRKFLYRAIGRPAMMAFMILVGTYLTTGQFIPGVF